MAGGQGVGVVGAQHPQPIGEQLLGRGGGAGRVASLTPPTGEVAARKISIWRRSCGV